MKYSFLVLFCILHFSVQGQSVSKQSTPLTIGEVKTISSSILKEERTLNIYLPQNYDATKSYPVIYLLDGSRNEDFLHITGLVQFFNLQFKMPDCILVGIGNIDRKKDFTFYTDKKDFQKEFPTTGHSAEFINFIEKELQPFIQSQYKTNGTNYLIGQSLGGLLATEIVLKHPNLFSHYLIVSPSLWWDDESLLTQAPELLSKSSLQSKYVYIAVGKKEHPVMQKDAETLVTILQKAQLKDTKIDFKSMPNDNHATILHQSIYEAFLLLFPFKE